MHISGVENHLYVQSICARKLGVFYFSVAWGGKGTFPNVWFVEALSATATHGCEECCSVFAKESGGWCGFLVGDFVEGGVGD